LAVSVALGNGNNSGRVYVVQYADLGPPPSLQHEMLHGIPSARFAFKDFSYGVPVPVRKWSSGREAISTQEQLSQTVTCR